MSFSVGEVVKNTFGLGLGIPHLGSHKKGAYSFP